MWKYFIAETFIVSRKWCSRYFSFLKKVVNIYKIKFSLWMRNYFFYNHHFIIIIIFVIIIPFSSSTFIQLSDIIVHTKAWFNDLLFYAQRILLLIPKLLQTPKQFLMRWIWLTWRWHKGMQWSVGKTMKFCLFVINPLF